MVDWSRPICRGAGQIWSSIAFVTKATRKRRLWESGAKFRFVCYPHAIIDNSSWQVYLNGSFSDVVVGHRLRGAYRRRGAKLSTAGHTKPLKLSRQNKDAKVAAGSVHPWTQGTRLQRMVAHLRQHARARSQNYLAKDSIGSFPVENQLKTTCNPVENSVANQLKTPPMVYFAHSHIQI